MTYFSNILTLVIFLIIGFNLAKKTTKYTYRSYNYIIAVLTILSFGVGRNTFLLKIFGFQCTLSIALSSLLLGILLRRFTLKNSLNNSN